MVNVNVNEIKRRTLLHTGAGSSCASATLVERLGKPPVHSDYRRIDMMICSINQKIEVYNVKVADIRGKFEMSSQGSKVDKSVLLSIPNPKYAEKISQYKYLKGVIMGDGDTKQQLPIHQELKLIRNQNLVNQDNR